MLHLLKPKSESAAVHIAKHLYFVSPNFLTLLGSIPSLLFFVFVLQHWYIAALIVYLGNSLDLLDGVVARTHQKVTAFGGFFDSNMDRISDAFIICAFGFAKLVRWEIVIPLLCTSFLVSYARSRGELASGNKIIFSIGIIERPERLIIIFLSLLFSLFLPNVSLGGFSFLEIIFSILLLLSSITFIQRLLYGYQKL